MYWFGEEDLMERRGPEGDARRWRNSDFGLVLEPLEAPSAADSCRPYEWDANGYQQNHRSALGTAWDAESAEASAAACDVLRKGAELAAKDQRLAALKCFEHAEQFAVEAGDVEAKRAAKLRWYQQMRFVKSGQMYGDGLAGEEGEVWYCLDHCHRSSDRTPSSVSLFMGELEKAMAEVIEAGPEEAGPDKFRARDQFRALWAESRCLPVNCRVLESYALRALASLARRWDQIGIQYESDEGFCGDYDDTCYDSDDTCDDSEWRDSEWRYAKAEEYARKALEVAEIHGNAVDVAFAQRDLAQCSRAHPEKAMELEKQAAEVGRATGNLALVYSMEPGRRGYDRYQLFDDMGGFLDKQQRAAAPRQAQSLGQSLGAVFRQSQQPAAGCCFGFGQAVGVKKLPKKKGKKSTKDGGVSKKPPVRAGCNHFDRMCKKKDKKSTKDGGVSKTTGKIYAVKKGRKTGLYTCCDAATAQVSGYKGGQMKRFNSRAEAQRYLNGTL